MKKCNSCNIKFNTTEKVCPLCQNKLVGNAEGVFPINYRYKGTVMLNKIMLFLSISIFIVCAFIDYQLNTSFTWSPFVALGLITNFIVTHAIIRTYKDPIGMLGKYGVIITLIFFIWYFYTKEPVITNYLIPLLCLIEQGLTIVIGAIMRNTYIFRYFKIILANIVLSLIPVLLVSFDLVTKPLLAYICAMVSAITLIGIVIFYYEDLKDELSRIFNY